MQQYWVVGGDYIDTRFETPAPGAVIEKLGPFASYEEAHKAWAGRAWATIDRATVRFRIVDDAGRPIEPRTPA